MNIDYYFSLNSPWTYLGHQRLVDMAKKADATVTPWPVDFRQTIFPQTGGLPVPQRPPARQHYRLQELERWRSYLDIPLNLKPAFWPADELPAETVLIAIRESGDVDAALQLAGLFMHGMWARDLNIGDPTTIATLAQQANTDESIVSNIGSEKLLNLRIEQSNKALERGVFGAPTYIIDDQILWGQDRLDFVERMLNRM